MKAIYNILGIFAIVIGALSFCGFDMSPTAAGCYAIIAGFMFFTKADEVK